MKSPGVAIILPVHRPGQTLSRCMDSLAALTPAAEEVLVVLDGLLPAMVEGQVPPSFKVLALADKRGPAAARNAGVEHSQAEIILFIDSDVSVPPGVLEMVVDEFNRQPELAALFGSYDDAPGQSNFLSQFKNIMHHYVHQQANTEAATFWGACGAIRRSAFAAMGGFDESLRWLEDVDLGMRMLAAGLKVNLVKSLQVKHWKRWTALSLLQSDIFHRAIPWTALMLRHSSLQNDLNTDHAARWSAFLLFLALGLVLASPLIPIGLEMAALSTAAVLWLNKAFYAFLYQKRGFVFMVQSLLWHCFYFIYSALAFIAGILLASLRFPLWFKR